MLKKDFTGDEGAVIDTGEILIGREKFVMCGK
jgi:hypothetical protein